MVGLVFAESRRRVTPAEAREMVAAAYVRRPRFVGVFVNEAPDVIGRLAGELRLDLVQLSGDEPPEECARLRVPYLKVVHVRSGMWPKGPLPDPGVKSPGSGSRAERGMAAQDVLRSAERYRDAVAIVLDSGGTRFPHPPSPSPRRWRGGASLPSPASGRGVGGEGIWGGTGVALDSAIAAEVVRRFNGLVMLAGGLRPDTVAGAVRAVRPWGVDVSSGVETDGAKDETKITAFVAAAKGAV
jgi:phosphoribosylanthranilate isomerase